MTIADVGTIAIAVISLAVSLWVVRRDRRDRRLDLLYQCYDRMHAAQTSGPFATVAQHVEMDADPENPAYDEYRERSKASQRTMDRELEFACYLVMQKEIDLDQFFDLFRGWLSSRSLFWKTGDFTQAHNHPFTVKVIQRCDAKGLLPLKNNERWRQLRRDVEEFHPLPENHPARLDPVTRAATDVKLEQAREEPL